MELGLHDKLPQIRNIDYRQPVVPPQSLSNSTRSSYSQYQTPTNQIKQSNYVDLDDEDDDDNYSQLDSELGEWS